MGAGSIIADDSISENANHDKAKLILKKATEAGELIKEIRKM